MATTATAITHLFYSEWKPLSTTNLTAENIICTALHQRICKRNLHCTLSLLESMDPYFLNNGNCVFKHKYTLCCHHPSSLCFHHSYNKSDPCNPNQNHRKTTEWWGTSQLHMTTENHQNIIHFSTNTTIHLQVELRLCPNPYLHPHFHFQLSLTTKAMMKMSWHRDIQGCPSTKKLHHLQEWSQPHHLHKI